MPFYSGTGFSNFGQSVFFENLPPTLSSHPCLHFPGLDSTVSSTVTMLPSTHHSLPKLQNFCSFVGHDKEKRRFWRAKLCFSEPFWFWKGAGGCWALDKIEKKIFVCGNENERFAFTKYTPCRQRNIKVNFRVEFIHKILLWLCSRNSVWTGLSSFHRFSRKNTLSCYRLLRTRSLLVF